MSLINVKKSEKEILQDKVNQLSFASSPAEIKQVAEAIENAYSTTHAICGVDFDELMSQLYDCNEEVIRSMGYDWYGQE